MTVLVGAMTTAADAPYGDGAPQLIAGSKFVASATGTATSMSVGLNTSPGANIVLCIYNSTGTTLLGYTNAFAGAAGTNTANLVSGVSIVSGTTYFLGCEVNSASLDPFVTGSGTNDFTPAVSYSSPPPSNISPLGAAGGNGSISITASGTVSSSSPAGHQVIGGFWPDDFQVQPFIARALHPSTHSFSYTMSGGLVLAGSAQEIRVDAPSPSGGLVLAGAAGYTRVASRSASGGLTFAGTAPESRVLHPASPTGGLVFGGVASKVQAYATSGGLQFSGAASHNIVKSVTGSGGIVFGGSANVVFNQAGGGPKIFLMMGR